MEAGLSMRLRQWLSGSEVIERTVPDAHLALAALLVTMMRSDFDDQGVERETATRMLARGCGLDRTKAEVLLSRGEQAADRSVSLYEHTRTLDATLSEQEKFAVIAALWEVAFADGTLDGHEDYLAHRLADLLHVRHSDLMRIKDRVVSRQG
jgi:uncharacterized tellurite resistance protein B-like protein